MDQAEYTVEESFGEEYDVEALSTEPEVEEIVEELDEDFEKSDSFTGMSAADKEKHRLEYTELIKEIEGQNNIVEQLKAQIMTSCKSPCLTRCEIKEFKELRACAENENLKLHCLVQKAIQMQTKHPKRFYEEIPIVTTFEEDVFPRKGMMEPFDLIGQYSESSRKHDVFKTCSKTCKKNKHCCHAEADKVIDSEICKLFKEMALKDKLMECLKNRVHVMQKKLDCRRKTSGDDGCQKQLRQNLENKIACMQSTVDMLNANLKSLCKEKQSTRPFHNKSNELRMLKEDYAKLLVNCANKDNQIQQLKNRVKGYSVNGTDGESPSADELELKMLRAQVSDFRGEQNEYSCIIKEQSEQLKDYRKKYIDAQQKVEEQKCILEKIEMTNKRIEGQIEAEIKGIKDKFKEQIREYSQYPKLLENEQIKLATACKDRDQLITKLALVCKELKSVKEKIMVPHNKPDYSKKLATCQQDLSLLQNKTEELQKEKDILCDELHKAKLELDTMRSESAKIIISNKERFEVTKSAMCSRIDVIEKELAQCRANAFLSVTDREAVIKEMQCQLSTLSYSFDSAQNQIKTLKNHITFLSNDQCISIK